MFLLGIVISVGYGARNSVPFMNIDPVIVPCQCSGGLNFQCVQIGIVNDVEPGQCVLLGT
jgi:hypothetical protein